MIKSASDNQAYPAFCLAAAQDETIFETFRQNESYQTILEHFTYEDGLRYLSQIKDENPLLLDHIELFRTNDNFGGAEIFDYPGIGKISPSTLHYIRQLAYLESYFGSLDGFHLVEIGGGYGGLAKIIMDRFNIASYTLYDLHEANQLTAKYLGKFGATYLPKLTFGNLENPAKSQYDLCISNCAFTECTPAIQDEYLKKVIQQSKRGFMLYNFRKESYHPVILLTKLEACHPSGIGTNSVKDARSNVFILAWNANIKLKRLPYRRRLVYKLSPSLYNFSLKKFQFLNKLLKSG